MSKVKTTFICNNCGTNFPKWQGQCTSCKSWNSISEEVILKTNQILLKRSQILFTKKRID